MTDAPGGDSVTYLSRDMFADRLGDVFHVEPKESPALDLVLVEAIGKAGERRAKDRPESFSLEFRGPNEPILEQRIYTLEHSNLGPLDLFLVAVGPDDQGIRYEAVFNYDI